MKRIDFELLDALSSKAAASERLRANYDLRDSPDDKSQKMLNALEPGTVLPVHRHRTSSEVVTVLRGRCTQYMYNDKGEVTGSVAMDALGKCRGMVVDAGEWHRLECLEHGTVILECKEGTYAPIGPEDILG